MAERFSFDGSDFKYALKFARNYAKEKYSKDLEVVLTNAIKDKDNFPSLKIKNKKTITFEEYIKKWVDAYLNGFENRPSKRIGKKSKTYSDSVIKIILVAMIPNLGIELTNKLEAGHALMMTIENLVGDLLEEYLSIKLKKHGWYCCWGATIEAVDFCHKDGRLLQIKNSDNSENSSSGKVRNGTEIKKWARRISKKEDKQYWDKLISMVGCKDLSEKDFIQFVSQTIKANPLCIYIDNRNPLK